LFSAERADAVKACLYPTPSDGNEVGATDGDFSDTRSTLVGPVALSLSDLAWAWQAPTTATPRASGSAAESGASIDTPAIASNTKAAVAASAGVDTPVTSHNALISEVPAPLTSPPTCTSWPPLVVPWGLPPLGQGTFGVVHACLWGGTLSAVKFQRLPPGDFDLTNLAVELALLKCLSHDHLVKFKGVLAVDLMAMDNKSRVSNKKGSNSSNGDNDSTSSSNSSSSSSSAMTSAHKVQEPMPPFLLPPPWRTNNPFTESCGFVGIVTELCAEGCLDDFLRTPGNLSRGIAVGEGIDVERPSVSLPFQSEASQSPPGFPASPQDGPPWAWRLQWSKELASALVYLHAKNILHRDVKVFTLSPVSFLLLLFF